MKKQLPRLFGHDARSRYLVGVAMEGPIAGRPLARMLDLDPSRMPSLYRHFHQVGVVSRDDAGRLQLNEDFAAFGELAVLLRALGGQRVIGIPSAPGSPQIPKACALFGSAVRTRVLAAIAAMDSINIKDLCYAAWCSRATARSILDALEEAGCVSLSREPPALLASLNLEFAYSSLLCALARRVADGTPAVARRVETLRASIAASVRSTREKPEFALLPFGTVIQSAVLLAVSSVPACLRDISIETGISQSSVRTAADVLEDHGLVVSTTVGSGPTAARWMAVNEGHPLAKELACYAKSLPDRICGRKIPPNDIRRRMAVRCRVLPGSRELRSLILFEIFRRSETTSAELVRQVQVGGKPVRRWCRILHSAGLIYSAVQRGKLVLSSDGFRSSPELKALVAACDRFVAIETQGKKSISNPEFARARKVKISRRQLPIPRKPRIGARSR